MPCGLILSVMVLSGGPLVAPATGASFTSIIIGSLFSSLPVRRLSRFIPYAPLFKELELVTCTNRAGARKVGLGAWLWVAGLAAEPWRQLLFVLFVFAS